MQPKTSAKLAAKERELPISPCEKVTNVTMSQRNQAILLCNLIKLSKGVNLSENEHRTLKGWTSSPIHQIHQQYIPSIAAKPCLFLKIQVKNLPKKAFGNNVWNHDPRVPAGAPTMKNVSTESHQMATSAWKHQASSFPLWFLRWWMWMHLLPWVGFGHIFCWQKKQSLDEVYLVFFSSCFCCSFKLSFTASILPLS